METINKMKRWKKILFINDTFNKGLTRKMYEELIQLNTKQQQQQQQKTPNSPT